MSSFRLARNHTRALAPFLFIAIIGVALGPTSQAEILPPAKLVITTKTLPNGVVGTAYSSTVMAAGGKTPYTWTIPSGGLPGGLVLNSSTGAITGTPTGPGTFTFTVQVKDSSSPVQTAMQSYTVIIYTALKIQTTSLPNGAVGQSYSATVSVTGGTTPYKWSISSGALPTGLKLSPTAGTINGTPTVGGTFTFTVQVKDSSLPVQTATQSYTITISVSQLKITTTKLANGTVGTSYTQTVTATGGTMPYTWSVSSGTLPNGLNLNSSTGKITGIPNKAGTFTFTIQVTDSSSPVEMASQSYTVIIHPATLVITTTSLPNGTQGVPYSSQLMASGGTPPYTWSITSGSLPPGLQLNTSSGFIAGTPSTVGSSTFTAQVTDSGTPKQIASMSFTITIVAGTVTITSGPPVGGTIGANYSFPFTAQGGTPPYAWTITQGSTPTGTSLGLLSGILSGTPTTGQTASFTVTVTDALLNSASQPDSISISVPPPPPVPILLGIQVQPIAPLLTIGGTVQLAATGVFSDGSLQDVTSSATWTSLDDNILSVNLLGLVTGLSEGLGTVTATAQGFTGYTMVSVGSLPARSPGSAANYYVATNGNDSWSGTIPFPNSGGTDGPFATLNRAREAVQGKPGSVVQIESGTYFLPATVNFTSADSGTATAPIVYENYPGAAPVISGGIKLTGWTNPSGLTWKVSLNPRTYPNIQNFEALFYTPSTATDGSRRYRPRAAITVNSSCVSGFLCNSTGNPIIVPSQSANCNVQVSGGWECFDRFYFNSGDVSATGYHGMGLGDVEVLDFEYWTMSRMRLSSVDSTNNIVYLTGPTYQNSATNGFFPGHRYLIDNVLESLTQKATGQWYVDRCPGCANTVSTPASTWSLSYIAQTGENPGTDTVIVPQLPQLMVGNGASNLIFQGITFSHDNWIPSSTGLGDEQGAPAVSAAVSFLNSQNVVFNSCIFSHTQGWALEFRNAPNTTGSNSNQVVNSEFYDLGAGAIRIGDVPTDIDTDAGVPQYNLVENNVIVSGGRIQPTGIGTGIWVGNAHHNIIVHNDVSDFYSGAIGVGLTFGILNGAGFAHDNIVALNHVYTLGQGVTSDMGGIYFATSATTGNTMLNNVVHDVTHDYLDSDGYGGEGLYFDQGTSNAVAQNNLVYRVSDTGVFNNLSDRAMDTFPQNNTVANNIFALSAQVSIQHGGENPSSFNYIRNIDYYDKGAIQGGNWACYDIGGTGQPVPCPTRFFLDANDYWNPLGVAPQFETTYPTTQTYTLSNWQPLGEDVHSYNVDPLFTDPNQTNDPPANGFTLQLTSPVFTDIGFVNFDPTQAGRSSPILIPPTVTCAGVATVGACPAFPLQVLSQTNGY